MVKKSTILPDFVGVSLIYNGKKFIPITISEDMVGHKLESFFYKTVFWSYTSRQESKSRRRS